jgi:hypothetical protein
MSVSAIVSSSAVNQANNLQISNQQQRTEFLKLTQALQSGNLTSAQQASQSLSNSLTSLASLQRAQLTRDLSALGSNLPSGHVAGASNAYSAASQNTQAPAHAAHHHHHGGGGGLPALTSGFPDSSSSAVSIADASDVFQSVNVTA